MARQPKRGPEGRLLNVSPARKGWDMEGPMRSAVGAALSLPVPTGLLVLSVSEGYGLTCQPRTFSPGERVLTRVNSSS